MTMTKSAWNLPIMLLGVMLVTTTCSRTDSDHDRADSDTFDFAGVEQLRGYFQAANYTLEDWDAGDRSVPRFYLASVPSRWRHEVAPNLPVALKKRYFFFVYAPLVLEANERISADRTRLGELGAQASRSPDDDTWLHALTTRYFLDKEIIDEELLDELTRRVDIVPPSLALAQAAVESGWSTSRFADMGNALFGQWTWGGDGITPTEQRDELGDYQIKAFDSPEQSIAAYMHNLNTHRSYADFRTARAAARDRAEAPRGRALAATLTSYSEKGQEYVEMLLSVIRINNLDATDEAFLRDMKPVLLVPVGPGSD